VAISTGSRLFCCLGFCKGTAINLAGVIAINDIPCVAHSILTLSSNILGTHSVTIGHRTRDSVLVHHSCFGIHNGFYTLSAHCFASLFSFLLSTEL